MRRTLSRLAVGVVAAGALFAAPAAHAGRSTNTVPVKLKVGFACGLETRPLTFVASNWLINSNIDATTTMTVKCTPNTPYNIEVNDGLYANGVNARQMISPTSGRFIPYQVYRNAARTQVWGTGPTKWLAGDSSTGAAQTVTMYGRVPSGWFLLSDQYNDTLVVTLNF